MVTFVRDVNIWVNEESPSQFILIDFDSGVIGEVQYPMNIYKGSDLERAEGVSICWRVDPGRTRCRDGQPHVSDLARYILWAV